MSDIVQTKIPTNFKYPEITGQHFLFGSGQLTPRVLRPDGDWRDYLPPEEYQNVRGIESSACYVEASQHAIATIIEEKYGVLNNNYSARFNALLSDGTEYGGDPLKGMDSIRHDGLITDEMMPFGDEIQSWADFHSWKGVDELKCRAMGKRSCSQWDIGYDVVFRVEESVQDKYKKARLALSYGPMAVSVAAWFEKDGVYIKPVGWTDNHLVELVHIDENNQATIRDTYAPFEKKLEPFFNFDFGMRLSVEQKVEVKKNEVLLTDTEQEHVNFWQGIIDWFSNLFRRKI